MNNNIKATRLDEIESQLSQQFRSHPVVANIDSLTDGQFEEILLQNRVFSLNYFEPFYNTAITSLRNPRAVEIARSIVREEYVAGHRRVGNGLTTNHREDNIFDLEYIGIPIGKILSTRPTEGTLRAMQAMGNLVTFTEEDAQNRDNYDVRAISALRFGGEILAGEQFSRIWEQLQTRHGMTTQSSNFYWPHVGHDSKRIPLGQRGNSHADRFGAELAGLLTSEENLDIARKSMEDSLKARNSFLDQFGGYLQG